MPKVVTTSASESTLIPSSTSSSSLSSLTLTAVQQVPQPQPPTQLTISKNSSDQLTCSDDVSPSLEQLDNLAAQFSPILGEGEHLFSPEELAKVFLFGWV